MRSGTDAVKDFKASKDIVLSTMFVAISRLQCNAPCLRGWRFSCSCKSLRINLSQSLVPWTSSNASRHSTQQQCVSFLLWAPFFSFILVRFMLHSYASSYALFSFMRCYQIPVHMLYVKWNLSLFIQYNCKYYWHSNDNKTVTTLCLWNCHNCLWIVIIVIIVLHIYIILNIYWSSVGHA